MTRLYNMDRYLSIESVQINEENLNALFKHVYDINDEIFKCSRTDLLKNIQNKKQVLLDRYRNQYIVELGVKNGYELEVPYTTTSEKIDTTKIFFHNPDLLFNSLGGLLDYFKDKSHLFIPDLDTLKKYKNNIDWIKNKLEEQIPSILSCDGKFNSDDVFSLDGYCNVYDAENNFESYNLDLDFADKSESYLSRTVKKYLK